VAGLVLEKNGQSKIIYKKLRIFLIKLNITTIINQRSACSNSLKNKELGLCQIGFSKKLSVQAWLPLLSLVFCG
jgi:hypothetical protein